MAHHNFETRSSFMDELFGKKEDADLRRVKDLLQRQAESLGATGQYPHGQYGEHDEGEIRFAIVADAPNRKVIVDFGKPVHSLGLTPEQAWELGELLQKKSWECRGIEST